MFSILWFLVKRKVHVQLPASLKLDEDLVIVIYLHFMISSPAASRTATQGIG